MAHCQVVGPALPLTLLCPCPLEHTSLSTLSCVPATTCSLLLHSLLLADSLSRAARRQLASLPRLVVYPALACSACAASGSNFEGEVGLLACLCIHVHGRQAEAYTVRPSRVPH